MDQMMPWLEHAKAGQWEVGPKDGEVYEQLEAAPALKPQQLLRLAGRYRQQPATASLGAHLLVHGLRQFVEARSVQAAVSKIAEEPVEFSVFDDIWSALVDAIGSDPSGIGPGTPCEFKCFFFTLWEKCGIERNYHIIGVCWGI